MRELAFHPAARAEAVAAALYLESERVGYGEKFELEALCERISTHPRSGASLEGYPDDLDIRAWPMPSFRYSLITAMVDGELGVFAVAHQHRQPGYWRDRLG